MLRNVSAVLFAALILTGCIKNYAEREVTQGTPNASLMVVGAPQGATVIIDARPYGAASAQPISLAPGRHDISVQLNGQTIHTQSVFAAAGARVEVRVQ